MVTRAAARHARTAPAVPGAVLVAVGEAVVPGAVLVAVEAVEVAVEVEVAGVVGVLAEAAAGANAKVQNEDQAQE